MPSNRTSIEIEGKGEFSQLTRGLRDVKSSLGEVVSVVNRGTRKGGLFSDNDQKALDLFARRYQQSMERMNRLMDNQGQKVANLFKQRRTANSADVASIDKEIKKQGQYLDKLEQERKELEDIMRLRQKEAQAFGRTAGPKQAGGGTPPPKGAPAPSSNDDGGSGAGAGAVGLLGLSKSLKGVAGFLAGVAGISLSIGQLLKWEQMAEHREISWAGTLQRNASMNRGTMETTGLRQGYNTFQTQQALDVYTQQAGTTNAGGLDSMNKFSRGYGVDLNQTASVAGQLGRMGYGSPGETLGKVAGVASSSGMDARILEVMETSVGFLQSMDKNLKDNSGNNILAYTARINQIGQEKGAQKLTGEQGANLLTNMGNNIFNPQNPAWQATGVSALRSFGSEDTKKKDTMDLMQQWQNGFSNPENIGVMAKLMDSMTQGMGDKQTVGVKKAVMQQAMGGNTTLQQAQDFGEATNWLHEFDPNNPKMKALLAGGNAKGSDKGVIGASQIDAKDQNWQETLAARIEKSNANMMQKQIEAGKMLIPAKLELQDFTAELVGKMTDALNSINFGDILSKNIHNALKNLNWMQIGGLIIGGLMLKKAGTAALNAAGNAVKNTAKKAVSRVFSRGGATAVQEVASTAVHRSATSATGAPKRSGNIEVSKSQKTPMIRPGTLPAWTEGEPLAVPKPANMADPIKATPGVPTVRKTNVAENAVSKAKNPLLKAGGRVLGKVPIIGGVLDAGINHYIGGQSWGESISRGAGSVAGGVIGGAVGSLLGPVGTVAGGVLGSMAGDWAGGALYNAFGGGGQASDGPSPMQTAKQGQYLQNVAKNNTISIDSMSTGGLDQLSQLTQNGGMTVNGQSNLSTKDLEKMAAKGTMTLENFSTNGARSLAELMNKGDVNISTFSKTAAATIMQASKEEKLNISNLTTEGKQYLLDLQDKGLIELGTFTADGSAQIKNLKKEGLDQLIELQKTGNGHLGSMDSKTTEDLDKIQKTHDVLYADMVKATKTGWEDMNKASDSFWSRMKNWIQGKGWKSDKEILQEQNAAPPGGGAPSPSPANVIPSVPPDISGVTPKTNNIGEDLPNGFVYRNPTEDSKRMADNPLAKNDTADSQKKVYATLVQRLGKDKADTWWNDVNRLVNNESSWNPQAEGSTVNNQDSGGKNVTAKGLFQFMPYTFPTYMPKHGDDARAWDVETQTDAFINYIQHRWHGSPKDAADASINNHSYADGTWVNHDKVAKIHGGEEIISRAKTGETLRKTGKLPSQILNESMSGSQTDFSALNAASVKQAAAVQASPAEGAIGSKRLDVAVTVDLKSDQPLPNESALVAIIKQVMEEASFKMQKGNPYFT